MPRILQLHGRGMPVTLGRASAKRTAVLPVQPSRRGYVWSAALRALRRHKQEPRGNAMLGLMQDWPLLCPRIIDHAAINHAERPIVTRSIEGPFHATNYAKVRDRVATLAWNTWLHLEAWYGIMGIGAIYHTVNPRLFPDQIAWIVIYAED